MSWAKCLRKRYHIKLHSRMPELKTVTMYATRPIRDGEHNGVEYFFLWTPPIWTSAGKMVF